MIAHEFASDEEARRFIRAGLRRRRGAARRYGVDYRVIEASPAAEPLLEVVGLSRGSKTVEATLAVNLNRHRKRPLLGNPLVGSVERVTFHNEENGFAVLKVKTRGRRDLVPVIGHAATISAGAYIHAVGVWINDRAPLGSRLLDVLEIQTELIHVDCVLRRSSDAAAP